MGADFLLMIFIMFFIFFVSFQSTHILIISHDSLEPAEDFNFHGNQNQIEKVSGEDESEKEEALIVQKFRDLLGLKSFKTRSVLPTDGSDSISPSPYPSPTIEPEAPAPSPALHIHSIHSHPPHSHSSPSPPHPKTRKGDSDKGKTKRIVAVLVSTGVVCVVCILGFICFCGKFKRHKKIPTRTVLGYNKKGKRRGKSKYVSTQNSSRKVSLNPNMDLLYLNSLGVDLEQQRACLKQTPETLNSSSKQSSPNYLSHERDDSNKELIKSEPYNLSSSSSSTREITSVHEEAESIAYQSDEADSSSGDRIIPVECHSSDDESFHSFVDSHSSNVRLSNASANGLSDTTENFTGQNVSLTTQDHALSLPPQFPCNSNEETFTVPVPPPPPLPPIARFLSSKSPPLSAKIATKAPLPSTMFISQSPGNPNSAPGSNETPESELLSSCQKSLRATPRIPPPPCPPPFLKGNSTSSKGPPPPPPSQFSQFTPLGKDGAPLPKLKPLHWDKVRASPDRSMVWDKLRSNSFELDEEMIESLFGYNVQSSMKNDEAKSKSPSPSKHVLEPKRLQNITILSKALNVTVDQVCHALIRGNGLCQQQLEALVKMVPTKEEEAKLSSYNGKINELGSAEQFVKTMLSVPFAFGRVEAMLYKETFEDEVVHLRNSFSMLEEACKELRSSRLFSKLLEAVLKTGNRMNVGTIRGGARAFKLDALLKLADVKGTDGKTTLLHFVVQEIIRSEGIRVSDSIMGKINQKNKTKTVEEKEEDYRRMGLDLVSGLSGELYNVKKTATIDLDVLAGSVSNLSDGMAKMKDLLKEDLGLDEKGGNFVHTMSCFLTYAERNLKGLKEDEDRVLLHVREVTEYFHGDVSKEEANPLRIFVIVRDFLGMLDHVCKELRSLKVPKSPNPLAPFR